MQHIAASLYSSQPSSLIEGSAKTILHVRAVKCDFIVTPCLAAHMQRLWQLWQHSCLFAEIGFYFKAVDPEKGANILMMHQVWLLACFWIWVTIWCECRSACKCGGECVLARCLGVGAHSIYLIHVVPITLCRGRCRLGGTLVKSHSHTLSGSFRSISDWCMQSVKMQAVKGDGSS